jgi:hypothetical protein
MKDYRNLLAESTTKAMTESFEGCKDEQDKVLQ